MRACGVGLILALAWGCRGEELRSTGDEKHGHGAGGGAVEERLRLPLAESETDEEIPPIRWRRSDGGVLETGLRAAPWRGDGPFRFAWDGEIPGPGLRLRVGDRLQVDLANGMTDPVSIHWHGVGAPFEMDGGLLHVPPGGGFRYTFPVQRAGTFWYHPHFDTDGQVDGGLYGPVIVEDDIDVPDVVWLFDIPEESVHHASGGEHGMGPRPNATLQRLDTQWWVNGRLARVYTMEEGRWLRARVINVSNAGTLWLEADDRVRWIGAGQGLFDVALPVQGVWVPPGARVELAWRVEGEGNILWNRPWVPMGGAAVGAPVPLVEVRGGSGSVGAWPFPGVERVDDLQWPAGVDDAVDEVIVFGGSDRSGLWTMNGAQWPDVEPWSWRRGDRPVVEVRNVSPSDHPFHVHGQVMQVVEVDGVGVPFRWMDDTVQVPAFGSVRLRLFLDAPGRWMAHCHLLPHAEAGMMGWVEVLDP
jgi:FtsP/CotA-like multicopper oxidase with cupredoxin domain